MESIPSITTPTPMEELQHLMNEEMLPSTHTPMDDLLFLSIEEVPKAEKKTPTPMDPFEEILNEIALLPPPTTEKNTPMAPTAEENILPTLAPTTAPAPPPAAAAAPLPTPPHQFEEILNELKLLPPPTAEKNTPMAPTPEENIPPALAPTTAPAPPPPAAAPPLPPTQRAQVLKRKRGERGLGKQNNKKVKNINPLECMRCGMVGLILHYPKPSPEIDHALIVFQSLFDDSLDLKMCKRCTKTSSNYKDGILNLLKLKV